MGISHSYFPAPEIHPVNPHEGTFIGGGMYGAVYRLNDTTVCKVQKVKNTACLTPDDSCGTEMLAYDWIDTIQETSMKVFFSKRLEARIILNPSYSYTPTEVSCNLQSTDEVARVRAVRLKKVFDKQNEYPYVMEIYTEFKGTQIDFTKAYLATKKQIALAFWQLLKIILFMKDHKIVHSDLHAGNVLMQSSGDLALIDYGMMYSEKHHALDYKRCMNDHVSMMSYYQFMVCAENDKMIEEDMRDSNISTLTSIQRRVRICLEDPVLGSLYDDFRRNLGIISWRSMSLEFLEADRMTQKWLIYTAKWKKPNQWYKKMMGYPPSSFVYTFFEEDAFMYFLLNFKQPQVFLSFLYYKLQREKMKKDVVILNHN